MVDIHSSVGHLTLTGKVTLGLADSDDVGEQTDVEGAIARVTITPSIDYVVVIADQSVVPLIPLRAGLNAAGQLVAPADGKATIGTSTSMRLIAPEQDSIHQVGWHWTVDIQPLDGQLFKPITLYVDGVPGDTKTLGGEILAGRIPTVSVYPSYIEIEDELVLNEDTGNYVVNVPEGTPLGSLLVGINADGDPVIFRYQ